MNIVRHPGTNMELGSPQDITDGSCATLPVVVQQTEIGAMSHSFWKPDADELAALNAGGSIVLGVRAIGRQHPVVSMGVTPEVFE